MSDAPGWQPRIDLGDGVSMPMVGCGTQYGFSADGNTRGALEQAEHYVVRALRAGFRLFDTARSYGTEARVARGLDLAGIDRREAFVVSKAWVGVDHARGVTASRAAIAESAARLGGWVDLYLVHQPVPGWQQLWQALETAKDEVLVRAIGVSNFGSAQLDELLRFARHRPVANQVHLHPFVYQQHQEQIDGCRQRGIAVIAFPRSPWRLGAGSALDAVAAACGRTRAQVMLRWAVEHGFAVIPLSTDERHLAENFAVREFRLTPDQVAAIDRSGERQIRFHVDGVRREGVAGWAFARGGLARIRVLVDGTEVGEATHGLPRPDVQAAHPGAPEALASGFVFAFPAGSLAAARELRLVFESCAGERAEGKPVPLPPGPPS
jgi:diketogulonate reductase-like aldo/keto reductase